MYIILYKAVKKKIAGTKIFAPAEVPPARERGKEESSEQTPAMNSVIKANKMMPEDYCAQHPQISNGFYRAGQLPQPAG